MVWKGIFLPNRLFLFRFRRRARGFENSTARLRTEASDGLLPRRDGPAAVAAAFPAGNPIVSRTSVDGEEVSTTAVTADQANVLGCFEL